MLEWGLPHAYVLCSHEKIHFLRHWARVQNVKVLLKSSKTTKIVKDNFPKFFLFKSTSGVYFLVNNKGSVYGGKRDHVTP